MPWTEITRQQYRRDGLRYASDMTDAEWALIERLSPRANRRGRPRRTDLRSVVKAIFYICRRAASGECCRMSSRPIRPCRVTFTPGAIRSVAEHRPCTCRPGGKKAGARAKPTAAVIDSQCEPTTQAGGPRGYAAGKSINGRKRHIVTDTIGLLLGIHVHPANVQDCHGAYRG